MGTRCSKKWHISSVCTQLSRASIRNHFLVKPKPGPFLLTPRRSRSVLLAGPLLLWKDCVPHPLPNHVSPSLCPLPDPLHSGSALLDFYIHWYLNHTPNYPTPSWHASPYLCHTLGNSGLLYSVVLYSLPLPCPTIHITTTLTPNPAWRYGTLPLASNLP